MSQPASIRYYRADTPEQCQSKGAAIGIDQTIHRPYPRMYTVAQRTAWLSGYDSTRVR